ncbi:MAG: YitT family protein, partial [Clostridia bacterium]|nr:YitT family protein [Clostridia bacterium]
ESTRIFAAIGAALCFGVAIALAFKIGGSSGGADILAVIIQKKFPAPSIAWMIFAVNAVIIGSSFFVFYDPSLGGAGATEGKVLALNLMPIALSLFESYIESKTNDAVTNGFQSAIEFRIITDKPEEMSLALMTELSRGVTSIPATGMYTKENHAMIVCVINRRQVVALKKVMRKVDPNAFAVMSNVSQVLGLGFYSSED